MNPTSDIMYKANLNGPGRIMELKHRYFVCLTEYTLQTYPWWNYILTLSLLSLSKGIFSCKLGSNRIATSEHIILYKRKEMEGSF